MKRKYALYPTIMSACALLCFIAVVIVFAGVVQPLWGRMLLLILPALILGAVAFFAAKGAYSCPISDRQVLMVQLRKEGTSWKVLQWQAVSIVEWE